MNFAFDLISDLHLETWSGIPDWSTLVTSPYCVIAGDVCRDRKLLIDSLTQLGQHYHAVFYIDGNDEHKDYWDRLSWSYRDLKKKLEAVSNVVYLQDHVVIINGVAILGTNAWWDFSMGNVDPTQAQQSWRDRLGCPNETGEIVSALCTQDQVYLKASVRKLQSHMDVKKIVVVTHTVPRRDLVEHDPEINTNWRMHVLGKDIFDSVIEDDIQNKIHTWCFGHYHGSIDQIRGNVRLVNNCRGRGDTAWRKYVYFPTRVEIPL